MYSYEDVLENLPNKGNIKHGEVQLKKVQDANQNSGPYGVVYQDPFVTLVRDPVLFPSMAEGPYVRVIQGLPEQAVYGVVILAIRPRPEGGEPDIAMVRQWRHARAGWMLEIPRGGIGSHEAPVSGALRELREETGLGEPDILVHMEDMTNDSGLSTTLCSYFTAVYMRPVQMTSRGQESREAIQGLVWAPMSEWIKMAKDHSFHQNRPIGGLDSFTAAAYGLAYATQTLPQLEQAWKRINQGNLSGHPKLGTHLRDKLARGRDELDIVVQCSSKEIAELIVSKVPHILHSPTDSSVLVLRGVSPLVISWILQMDEVISIESR